MSRLRYILWSFIFKIKVYTQTEVDEIVGNRTAAAAAQIAQIQAQKAAKLAELNKQYAVQDKIKNTAGIIGVVSIFTLCSMIISIDVFNLVIYLCFENNKAVKQSEKNKNKKRKITKPIYRPWN